MSMNRVNRIKLELDKGRIVIIRVRRQLFMRAASVYLQEEALGRIAVSPMEALALPHDLRQGFLAFANTQRKGNPKVERVLPRLKPGHNTSGKE